MIRCDKEQQQRLGTGERLLQRNGADVDTGKMTGSNMEVLAWEIISGETVHAKAS